MQLACTVPIQLPRYVRVARDVCPIAREPCPPLPLLLSCRRVNVARTAALALPVAISACHVNSGEHGLTALKLETWGIHFCTDAGSRSECFCRMCPSHRSYAERCVPAVHQNIRWNGRHLEHLASSNRRFSDCVGLPSRTLTPILQASSLASAGKAPAWPGANGEMAAGWNMEVRLAWAYPSLGPPHVGGPDPVVVAWST